MIFLLNRAFDQSNFEWSKTYSFSRWILSRTNRCHFKSIESNKRQRFKNIKFWWFCFFSSSFFACVDFLIGIDNTIRTLWTVSRLCLAWLCAVVGSACQWNSECVCRIEVKPQAFERTTHVWNQMKKSSISSSLLFFASKKDQQLFHNCYCLSFVFFF